MNKLISDKQIQTIKYELNYYSDYCKETLKQKIEAEFANKLMN